MIPLNYQHTFFLNYCQYKLSYHITRTAEISISIMFELVS